VSLHPPHAACTAQAAALKRIAAIVGSDWLFTSDEATETYLDFFAPGDAEDHRACGAVAPATLDELRAILQVAREAGLPLWTVSAGRNLAYGGAAPVLRGSLVVDLKRMNRVIEVDDDLGYAIVEPGVTFFSLFDHLAHTGSSLWISSPAPGWGSVIGNGLEHGFGPTAYGDHSQQICGLELMLADGSIVRTGMGALPGAATWPLFKGGYGPSYDLLFLQSNFAIVTKMGIWLMPRPEAVAVGHVKLAREADLASAIETLRPLRLEGVIGGVTSMRNVLGTAAGATLRSIWYDGPGPIPDEVLQRMMRQLDCGWWTLQFAHYGLEGVVQAQLARVRAAFESIPGARIDATISDAAALRTPARGGGGSRVGLPSLNALGIVDWRGGTGAHIDFSPVLAPRGADAERLHTLMRGMIEQAGLDYIGTFYNFGRAMALICAIVFNRSLPEEMAAVRSLFPRLIDTAAAHGFGEYRTHISYMDQVARAYSWNDHALLRLGERIKDALDPHGILAPGKQGLWPTHLRKAG